MPWLFLLIGICIGAGMTTLFYDGIEARLRAELDSLRRRERGPNVIDLTGMREKRGGSNYLTRHERRTW